MGENVSRNIGGRGCRLFGGDGKVSDVRSSHATREITEISNFSQPRSVFK